MRSDPKEHTKLVDNLPKIKEMHDSGMPYPKIGAHFGVSGKRIGWLMLRHGLSKQYGKVQTKYSSILPKEELEDLFCKQLLGPETIAALKGNGLTRSKVERLVYVYGIENTQSLRAAKHKKIGRSKRQDSYVTSKGYRYIRISDADGERHFRLEHIAVVEKFIGRSISKDEQVHHIGFDGLENRIEMLALMSASQHTEFHKYMERCCAYFCGFMQNPPAPMKYDKPILFGGKWVTEIDLTANRQVISTASMAAAA